MRGAASISHHPDPGIHLDSTRGATGPHLRLLLADGCNLRCSYCHFHATHDAELATQAAADGAGVRRPARRLLAADTAVAALRDMADLLRARGLHHLDLSLYGGEPLINPRTLGAVLEEVVAQRAANGLSITPIVNTNATLVDAAIAARWAAVGVRAHVSLDGPDLASNARRRLHSGAASLSAVLRGLSLLQRAGVAMQMNVVLSDANLGRVVELLPLARDAGCDQVFLALPDAPGGCGVGRPELSLPTLLAARAAARRTNMRVVGPWSVGTRAPSDDGALPLGVIVRTDGRAFVTHRPDATAEDVAALLAPARWAELQADWQALRAGCAGCELDRRCRSYLKAMTRYHAGCVDGAEAAAEPECQLARRAARMLNHPLHTVWRTAPWLHAEPVGDDGDHRLLHPALVKPIEVSGGVLDLLDHFLPGSTNAAAIEAFESPDLQASLDELRALGLLQALDDGDDQRRFATLVGPAGAVDVLPGFCFGAADVTTLAAVAWLQPHLAAALARLPKRLQPVVDRCMVFACADAADFARATGWSADHAALDWMAATVSQGLLMLNRVACARLQAQRGHTRLAAFEQQLAHELVHLGLRQRGLRLPVWLEEGVCEALSGAPLDDARLGEALPHASEFAGFVRACMGLPAAGAAVVDAETSPRGQGGWSPETTLLRFSDAPVDINPAYALAHGFVRHLIGAVGVDALLDAWSERGLRARRAPFPLHADESTGTGIVTQPLMPLLEGWLASETQRIAAATLFGPPMRVLSLGRQALVYHRIVGGHAWVTSEDEARLASLANRNLELADVADLLADHPDRDTLLPKWRIGQLARQRGFHLRLTIEGGCNMSCSYCYEGEKKRRAMSVETADQAIAAWRDLLGPADLPGSTVRIFGGEPFLNWPLMQHVFENATRGLPNGSVSWYLNTNGTLINDDHVAYLAALPEPLMVHLSLDGVGAVNDRDRFFNNGRGTFDRVDCAARKLLAAGITLNFSMVLTPANAHGLPDLLGYVARLRDEHPAAPLSFSIKPVIGPDLTAEQARVMHEALRAGLTQGVALGLDVGGEPLRAANLLFQDATPTGHFCGVSGRELYVAPDGQLMVCHAMPGSEYATVMDVAESHHIPVPDEIRNRHAGGVDGCSGCEVEGLCGGGCMAQSRQAHGSVSRKPSDYFCRMMKGTFRDAVQQGLRGRAAAAGAAAATDTYHSA